MVSPEIAQFAERVRRALSHLPADQVAELTDGLEANMAASVADGTPLPDIDTYVSQLLTAAGLEVPRTSAPDAPSRSFVDAVRGVLHKVVTLSHGLAPMWWLLRAFLFVVILGQLTTDHDSLTAGTRYVAVGGSDSLGIVLLIVAIVGSVWWGRSRSTLPSWAEIVLAAVLVVFGTVIIRDELHSAEIAANLVGYNGQCTGLGYDSQGRIGFPKAPIPDLVGLSPAEADEAVMEWGRGLAMVKPTSLPEPVTVGDQQVVVEQSDPYFVASGPCPYVMIDVRISAEDVASSTTTTMSPTSTTTSTVAVTTTSFYDGEATPTTSPGAVTATTVLGVITQTTASSKGMPTTSNPVG